MKARVKTTLVKANTLRPGDLFSNVDDNYWSTALDGESLGERVYIRTNVPRDDTALVYRITILRQRTRGRRQDDKHR